MHRGAVSTCAGVVHPMSHFRHVYIHTACCFTGHASAYTYQIYTGIEQIGTGAITSRAWRAHLRPCTQYASSVCFGFEHGFSQPGCTGLRILCMYAHEQCGHCWVVTWSTGGQARQVYTRGTSHGNTASADRHNLNLQVHFTRPLRTPSPPNQANNRSCATQLTEIPFSGLDFSSIRKRGRATYNTDPGKALMWVMRGNCRM